MPKTKLITATILAATAAFAANANAAPYPGGYGPMPGWGGAGWPAGHQAVAPQRREAPAPVRIIEEGLGKLQAFLASGAARDSSVVESFLIGEIAPYFDLDYMARWAAGSLWDGLDQGQQGMLSAGLAKLFFANMAAHIGGVRGGEIHYLPTRRLGGNEVTVRVRVRGIQSRPVALDFRLYKGNSDKWKVFDIQANGQSAVTHYRRLLADLARQRGIAGMLATLNSQ
jgi:phospholipid transport system substrate-binding protein